MVNHAKWKSSRHNVRHWGEKRAAVMKADSIHLCPQVWFQILWAMRLRLRTLLLAVLLPLVLHYSLVGDSGVQWCCAIVAARVLYPRLADCFAIQLNIARFREFGRMFGRCPRYRSQRFIPYAYVHVVRPRCGLRRCGISRCGRPKICPTPACPAPQRPHRPIRRRG